jgi:2,5-diamino-6-(ribosylamino)-4(3H)-pyrimidinone 5'-phosphate reductase
MSSSRSDFARGGSSTRPYVICHMVPSVDGRIVTKAWALPRGLLAEYERTAASFEADAWIIGRISMEPYAGKSKLPTAPGGARIPRTDFVARSDAPSYAIAIDPGGKLRWESGSIDEEHAVTVLTEQVPDRYLAFLRSRGVSYLFGGRSRIDVPTVLRKLRSRFGIRRLLLEGGGKINGSFLAAGAIDELSLLIAPVADGGVGTPTLFDAREGPGPARHLKLMSVERRRGDLLWVRYEVRRPRRVSAQHGDVPAAATSSLVAAAAAHDARGAPRSGGGPGARLGSGAPSAPASVHRGLRAPQ